MNLADRRRIGTARLAALGLSRPLADPTPMGVVQAHAAMQAQDLGSGLWSIGLRTGGVVDDVLAAVERREITRTWPMRGTLHWVPAADVGWMCQLLSGPAQRGADRVLAAEGLTEAIVGRAEQRWAEHLDSAGTMSRAEATEVLARARDRRRRPTHLPPARAALPDRVAVPGPDPGERRPGLSSRRSSCTTSGSGRRTVPDASRPSPSSPSGTSPAMARSPSATSPGGATSPCGWPARRWP
ncbi:MAG: crosslink repair DNA glycosylase YcaQ family protein [Dermatophilaceae bacterium]